MIIMADHKKSVNKQGPGPLFSQEWQKEAPGVGLIEEVWSVVWRQSQYWTEKFLHIWLN